jgi:hypothetical protein
MTSPTKEEQEKHHQQQHHQWIYEETAEMSDLLGINPPQIRKVGVDLDAGEVIGKYDEYSGQHSKDLAYKAKHKTILDQQGHLGMHFLLIPKGLQSHRIASLKISQVTKSFFI